MTYFYLLLTVAVRPNLRMITYDGGATIFRCASTIDHSNVAISKDYLKRDSDDMRRSIHAIG